MPLPEESSFRDGLHSDKPLDFRVLLLYRIGRTCDGIAQGFESGYKEIRSLRSVLIPVIDSRYWTATKDNNLALEQAIGEYYDLASKQALYNVNKNMHAWNTLLYFELEALMRLAHRRRLLEIGRGRAEVI